VERVRGQLTTQPLPLGGARVHRNVAVQRIDLPRAKSVAIVAKTAWACIRAKIVEIGQSARRFIIMIARRRSRTGLVTAPRGIVAIAIVVRASRRGRVVPRSDTTAG